MCINTSSNGIFNLNIIFTQHQLYIPDSYDKGESLWLSLDYVFALWLLIYQRLYFPTIIQNVFLKLNLFQTIIADRRIYILRFLYFILMMENDVRSISVQKNLKD